MCDHFRQVSPVVRRVGVQAVDGKAVVPASGGSLSFMNLVVTFDNKNKVYRLIDNFTNIYFVHSGGQFPYVPSDEDQPL